MLLCYRLYGIGGIIYAWASLLSHSSGGGICSRSNLERNPCNVAFQQSRPHQITAWQALIQHAYKVNFDGAVFVDEGLAGLGVVIRNDHGFSYSANTST